MCITMTAPVDANSYANIQNTLWSSADPPSLIYVAIGCGQGGNPPDTPPEQEYPPQIDVWPGDRKMCILIDPHLEDPIRAVATEVVTFYPIRQPWDWNSTADRTFLYGLINFVMRPQSTTRLVVQDYTGVDIRPHYPLEVYPAQELLSRVLFDFTQVNPGCYINFSQHSILCDRNGDFIQTQYLPLMRFGGHRDRLKYEMQERYLTLTHYVHRLWRIQEGLEPPRDWLHVEDVAARIRRLCVAYNLPRSTTQDCLVNLLTQGLNDFALVTHTPLTMAEMDGLVTSGDPRGEPLSEALKLMMATVT
jgi:hypothetical protein